MNQEKHSLKLIRFVPPVCRLAAGRRISVLRIDSIIDHGRLGVNLGQQVLEFTRSTDYQTVLRHMEKARGAGMVINAADAVN